MVARRVNRNVLIQRTVYHAHAERPLIRNAACLLSVTVQCRDIVSFFFRMICAVFSRCAIKISLPAFFINFLVA